MPAGRTPPVRKGFYGRSATLDEVNMMKKRIVALAICAALAALPLTASARGHDNDDAVLGGVLGAVVGGIIGSTLAPPPPYTVYDYDGPPPVVVERPAPPVVIGGYGPPPVVVEPYGPPRHRHWRDDWRWREHRWHERHEHRRDWRHDRD
jgi:hypothetical protein